MEERLQKFLASSGVASRRKSEELIASGKVKVNGKVVTELGTKVDPEKDRIEYNEKILKEPKNKVYILLNKPIGYVTTVSDQFGRDTVLDLVKVKERVVPVGRLDMYTSGALILTNDGDFAQKVTHPKNEIEKNYNVTIAGKITDEEVEKLRSGVVINIADEEKIGKNYENKEKNSLKGNSKNKVIEKASEEIKENEEKKLYKTGKAKVKILKIDEEKNISRIQITIHEGKNREVRKMCEAIDKKVLALHRAKIGNLTVKDLPLGKWRYLKGKEVQELIK